MLGDIIGEVGHREKAHKNRWKKELALTEKKVFAFQVSIPFPIHNLLSKSRSKCFQPNFVILRENPFKEEELQLKQKKKDTRLFLKIFFFIFNILFHNWHEKFDRQIIVSNETNQIESWIKHRCCAWVQKRVWRQWGSNSLPGHGTVY